MRFDIEVDCLNNGAPYSNEVKVLYNYFLDLINNPGYNFIKCYCTLDLFHRVELLQEDIYFKINDFKKLLTETKETIEAMIDRYESYRDKLVVKKPSLKSLTVEKFTAKHYGSLFSKFSDEYYYKKSFSLLKERIFDRNNIELSKIRDGIALDSGCGAGRFSLVLKEMGFKRVYGIDLGLTNIKNAIKFLNKKRIQGVFYKQGNVLNLPYNDASFDFVLSNGVLHHTCSIERGLKEIHRVLKAGGTGFLYVLEKPGGIMIDTIELLRVLMYNVDLKYSQKIMKLFGVSSNRIYTILDHIKVPINKRFHPEEVESVLNKTGFKNFKRLTRGLPHDNIEKLRLLEPNDKEAIWKYGVGENRYYFIKK